MPKPRADELFGEPPEPQLDFLRLETPPRQVLEARPDYVLAWRLRGEVLCARLGEANWAAAPRSASELAEAGRCLQRAATFSCAELAAADKVTVVQQAMAAMV